LQSVLKRKIRNFAKTAFNQCIRDVAQSGRVRVWGARGRKFESCHPDHFFARCRYSAETQRILPWFSSTKNRKIKIFFVEKPCLGDAWVRFFFFGTPQNLLFHGNGL
jgi:hypothetical protein